LQELMPMSRSANALMLFLAAFLCAWGCSRNGGSSAGQAERVRTLEARCSRLEDDYRTAAAARDQARKQATALEEERAHLEEQQVRLSKEVEQVRAIARERDDLRQLLDTRSHERDALQERVDAAMKTFQDIQALAGKAGSAMASPAAAAPSPPAVAIPAPPPAVPIIKTGDGGNS
jgi:hypothetical protein